MKNKKYFGFCTVALLLLVVIIPAVNEIHTEAVDEDENNDFKVDYSSEKITNLVSLNEETAGTATIFYPGDYTSPAYQWSTSDTNWSVSSANWETGAIGTYTCAARPYSWIPYNGQTADAMQHLQFYVGTPKTVTVEAEILLAHGAMGWFTGFAGTYKTYSFNDFSDNFHKITIDPWWDWDQIQLAILGMVGDVLGIPIGTIWTAIMKLAQILYNTELFQALMDLYYNDNAQFINVVFSFTAQPGYNDVWVGTRSSSSATWVNDQAEAFTAGQVTSIKIDGIAAPSIPTLTGPDPGYVGEEHWFTPDSTDPNNDDVQFKFDWGDGEVTDWTDIFGKYPRAHTYSDEGVYTIKVWVKDRDNDEAEDYGTYTINIDYPPPNTPNKPSGPIEGNTGSYYDYSASTTDPNGYDVYYNFDWGDGEYSGWQGPYNSGDTCTITNAWTDSGNYHVEVKAKNTQDAESQWSEPLIVEITEGSDDVYLYECVTADWVDGCDHGPEKTLFTTDEEIHCSRRYRSDTPRNWFGETLGYKWYHNGELIKEKSTPCDIDEETIGICRHCWWSSPTPGTGYIETYWEGILLGTSATYTVQDSGGGDNYHYPIVDTLEASNIGSTSALMNGELIYNGNDDNCIVFFDFKETGTDEWINVDLGIVNNGEIFSETASLLKPDTEYKFRAGAVNKRAVVLSEIKTFKTKENSPPKTPCNPKPGDNDNVDVKSFYWLEWFCEDPDKDLLYYDIYFGTSYPLEKIEENYVDQCDEDDCIIFRPVDGKLEYETTYYWKIEVKDEWGLECIDPSLIWSFTTNPYIPEPDLDSGSYDDRYVFEFTCLPLMERKFSVSIRNNGDSGSKLNWNFEDYNNKDITILKIEPDNGDNLGTGKWVHIDITFKAPLFLFEKSYQDQLVIINSDDRGDNVVINIYTKLLKINSNTETESNPINTNTENDEEPIDSNPGEPEDDPINSDPENPINPIQIVSVSPEEATVEEGETVEFIIETEDGSGNNYLMLDANGDGTADISQSFTGTTVTVSYTYPAEGTYLPDVEVHDLDEGLYDSKIEFAVISVTLKQEDEGPPETM